MRFCRVVLLTVFVFTVPLFAQLSETELSWNLPVEPFEVAGNIFYVGASDVTSYLITSPKGHILLDSGFRETVPQIKANIVKLGFRVEDVRVIINSHAHYDHAGGIAELKRVTGARLYASEADAKLLELGGKNDPNFGDRFPFEPVEADRTFTDGWQFSVGGVVMTANVTPGHTKGCTSWTTTVKVRGRKLTAIFVCSVTAPGYTLVGNRNYPEIASDYEATFKRLKSMKVDVFLSSHASAFDMSEKLERRKADTKVNPFIDPKGYSDMLERTQAIFRRLLADQSK